MIILRRKSFARIQANKIKLRNFWINKGKNKILSFEKLRTPGSVIRITPEDKLIKIGRDSKYATQFFDSIPRFEYA